MKYSGHFLLSRYVPILMNEDNVWKIKDWEFHYQGWTYADTGIGILRGDTEEKLLPKARLGYLDADILKRLGMTE